MKIYLGVSVSLRRFMQPIDERVGWDYVFTFELRDKEG